MILYLHGGAYVGVTAASARFWTYPWAEQAGALVFAVNYRKPPVYATLEENGG